MDLAPDIAARPGGDRGIGFVIALQAARSRHGDGIAARAGAKRVAKRAPIAEHSEALLGLKRRGDRGI